MSKLVAFTSIVLAVAVLAGCKNPLHRTAEQEIRDNLIAEHRKYVQSLAGGPVVELSRTQSQVEADLSDDRRDELDRMSGPTAYEGEALLLGKDLLNGKETDVVPMTLFDAIRAAIHNNLDLQIARLQPAIDRAAMTQAEAAFDATWFVTLENQIIDTPTPPALFSPTPGTAFSQENSFRLSTGIRKTLTTGGSITVSTTMENVRNNPSFFTVGRYQTASVDLTIAQPLLRGFGEDASRTQIVLTRSAREQNVERLRATMMDIAIRTEQAYWDLVFARQQLLIQTRLLDRTRDDRDQLKQRGIFDANPVQVTEASSFVELRHADVIRARQNVRVASDRLKQLINNPDLPVTGEQLILPVENPADVPMQFSLLDAVTTALRNRPEMQVALLQISDATTRQRLADNLRLPQLDLSFTTRFNGVSTGNDGVGDAYGQLEDGDFIDYLLAVNFSVPIGNRGPEAQLKQRKIERKQAVVNYQRQAQQVVLEVKESLRALITAYELIGATRSARRAASDNLRAIEAQEDAGTPLTPEFLNLKLDAQQRVADSERQEIQSLVDYNTSISRLYQSMGTLLERNGIEFVDPQ